MDGRAKELDEKLKATNARKTELEARIISEFEQEGVASMKVMGRTVYTQRNLWAGVPDGVDRQETCEALKDAGLGDFVAENFNTQTVSAYFREIEKAKKSNGELVMEVDELIPESLRGKIKLSEKFGLRSRKA
jgi:hypothetical protein